MKAFAQIIRPALFMSIQDAGRKSLMHFGVPKSGYMDIEMAHLANALIKNEATMACLEIFGSACTLRFSQPTTLALTSQNASLLLNGEKIMSGCGFIGLQKGDEIGLTDNKAWAYLAIKNGWISPIVSGSQSMMQGLTSPAHLHAGHSLEYKSSLPDSQLAVIDYRFSKQHIFHIQAGPEYHLLSQQLANVDLTISPQSTRQSTVFHEKLEVSGGEIPTGMTIPGTIQLTPAGTAYILNRDGQTTGGYFRIGFLQPNDLNLLNRLIPGEKLSLVFG